MRNKLFITTLVLFLVGVSFAQERGFAQEPQISVYPNPTVETLYVDIKDIQVNSFELTSMIGTKIKIVPEEVGIGRYKLTVKGLASGYYFLVIKGKDDRFNKAIKFLKK
jgi:hypothetical protein